MENFEFKSQIKERINKYKNLETPEEKAKYFKEMMIEFEDVEIQKYILEEKQRLEKMRRFGRKTEKNPDGSVQLSFYDLNSDLFNEAEDIASQSTEPEPEYETITYKRRKRRNKTNSPNQNLVEVTIVHKLENTTCQHCGEELQEMGYTEIRTYNYIPPS